ncbi:uncharacterized protein DUF4190 [Georgenia soli]|uniref:Uncharacterized protein DUF4190 n=1 Tax=Georgenia soli TaxID=638953 RepID=A0A2A9EKE8_9MICO|nr:DUF4190 domain-containing protein [Georgenia soli]PFG39283.1 uncharacterized protein DUF4190 [Georgenia soli]
MSWGENQHGGAAGAPRPDNPFASPSARPAPPPRAFLPDYAAAPLPGAGPSPYMTSPGPETSMDDGAPVAFPGSELVDRGAVLAGPGYTSAVVRNDPLAVAALILGVLAVVPGLGVAAVVCGHLALRRLADGYAGGRGLAVAGLVLGYVLTALWVLLVLAVWGVRDLFAA